MKTNVIYTEDCQEGMPKRLPDGCIDLMPTDPPYGIAFMGKEWDKFNEVVRPQGAYESVKGFKKLPRQSTASMKEFFVPRWRECLRVLKAGGFAFVMCSPRADVMATQILCLQEAGFMVGFTPIFWAYASGFPKSQNIGKAVDKRRSCDVSGYINKSGKTDKEIANYCEVSPALVRFWRLNERQIQLNEWNKLKRFLGVQNTRFDVNLLEAEREVIGRQKNAMSGWDIDGGTKFIDRNITLPATPQAQALDGSYAGFQPKPAVEVILVAMKPLSEKTYVDQALKNKKGITWLENGKIPYKTQEDIDEASNKNRHADFGSGPRDNKIYGADKRSRAGQGNYDASKGRFPGNLLCSDDVLNDGKVRKSTGGKSGHTGAYQGGYKEEYYQGRKPGLGDIGSFSRYFSLDSWWEKKLKELPEGVQKTFPFLIVPKASKAEKNRGCEELYWEKDSSSFGYHQVDRQRWIWLGKKEERIHKETGKRVSLRARGNVHPTVKPIKLMSYLIALGSREGDVILDPYIGTGRTAIAAMMMRRRYIGFDSSPESVKIAKAALSEVQLRLI